VPAVYAITWEPPAVTGRYRHMQRRDVAVWERFLTAHGAEWDMVAYDVALGGAEPIGEELTAQDRAGWKYNTALKIDALLRTGEDVWAIEVRPAAWTSAIGAALCYPRILEREEPDLIVAGGGIVCEHLPPDIAWLAEQLAVRVWVV